MSNIIISVKAVTEIKSVKGYAVNTYFQDKLKLNSKKYKSEKFIEKLKTAVLKCLENGYRTSDIRLEVNIQYSLSRSSFLYDTNKELYEYVEKIRKYYVENFKL